LQDFRTLYVNIDRRIKPRQDLSKRCQSQGFWWQRHCVKARPNIHSSPNILR